MPRLRVMHAQVNVSVSRIRHQDRLHDLADDVAIVRFDDKQRLVLISHQIQSVHLRRGHGSIRPSYNLSTVRYIEVLLALTLKRQPQWYIQAHQFAQAYVPR